MTAPQDDSDLDPGLQAAFRKPENQDQANDSKGPPPSILDTLARKTGSSPRVHLHSVDEGHSPIVEVLARGSDDQEIGSSRYQILGEIARGGVGVIYKGRDVDLGRDVAMKVLHEKLKDRADILHRFVEEAQIGGQLQHPGIVPVYEMGLQADERPFFAMKLVKGQTLTALLDQRSDPTQDRRNLLRIFEQVCQTMAYAHSRNVVHRDLKPSNVMVGAFGEVQVVDWGFAKVLKKGGIDDEKRAQLGTVEAPQVSIIETVRSAGTGAESLVGSVMGTPAYMPPEQAVGDVDHMDEMSDVFSLGAILTEILTGKPPHVKEGNEEDQELIMKAARCQVEPVFRRLDESGSDPELVRIVKRCLQPERKQRPRNAGVLAAQIQDHLSRVQERAQQAQVRAAQAEVRAQAERKARKLTLGLAAAVLAAVVLGGAGLFWAEREHQGRVEIASRIARAAIEEASLLRGKAQVAPVEDLSGWAPAVAGIEEAVKLAAEADTATRERAAELLVAFRREQAAAAEAAATARRDRLLVARLTDIRTRRADRKLRETKNPDYAALFAELDLDAAAIRGHRLRDELVGALDDWGGRPELVQAADPDPWRNEVRRLTMAKDQAALLEHARPENLQDLPAASLVLLATSLNYLYRQQLDNRERMDTLSEARKSVLEAAYEHHPNDFWVCFDYGQTRTGIGSARALSKALAQRPGTPSVRLYLGLRLVASDPDQAFEVLRDLYSEAPEYRDVRKQLGHRYMARATTFLRRRAYQASVEANRRATELLPDSAVAFHNLGYVLSRTRQWDKAVAAMQEAIRRDPNEWLYYHRLGSFQQHRDDKFESALRAFRKAMELRLRHISNVDKKLDAPFYRDYAIALEKSGDPEGALGVYHRLIPLDGFWQHAWHIAALHRQTKGMESAIAFCREVARVHYLKGRSQNLLGHYLLVSGAKAEAMQAFKEERRLLEAAVQADPGNPNELVDLAFDLANSKNLELRHPRRALALIRQARAIYERLIKNRRVTIRNIDTVMQKRRAHRILGYVLYRCGNYKAAIATLRKDERNRWCQVFLAMSHWQLGNKPEARSWLQKATAQGSKSLGVQENLPYQSLLAEARALLDEGR